MNEAISKNFIGAACGKMIANISLQIEELVWISRCMERQNWSDIVKAGKTANFLNNIFGNMDISAPEWNSNMDIVAFDFDNKLDVFENAFYFFVGEISAKQIVDLR